nr:YwqG family protein [Microcoleus sp. FACHB-68]
MKNFELPLGLERFRSQFEATIKPYIEIQTHVTREVNPWQSKFAGFPYLPKNFDYPKTPEGEYLYLLAQINFEKVPHLEGFPEKGILQFYISERGDGFGCDFENPTIQTGFRVLYFPEPDLNEDHLLTDFSFLPTFWARNHNPFRISRSSPPDKKDCFALTFKLKYSPITTADFKFDKLIGEEIWEACEENFCEENDCENNGCLLWEEYHNRFEKGHRLGGYPFFSQNDPRELLAEEADQYILLLQIDSEGKTTDSIQIIWGDVGRCNFFIQESALRNLDFSSVLYNWDCG